jgi:hypothetical protein
MLSTIPKHKGTEKMQADLKRRIAELRDAAGRRRGGHRASGPHVERSGAAQVALVGPPNSGKSSFVARWTHARPEVAAYPYTTRVPTPGLLVVEKVPIQVVDLPPLGAETTEPWLADLLRNADLLLVLLDLSTDDLLADRERMEAALGAVHISLAPAPAEGGEGVRHARWLLAGNKVDLPGARDRAAILAEAVAPRPTFTVSIETGEGVGVLLREMLRALDLVRIYTKEPGREIDLGVPFVLPRGSRVQDAARAIHKDLAERMRFARAWGGRFYGGQTVGRDVLLEDGDVLEFHD